MAWHQVLDRAHSLAQLAELEADPGRVRDALAAELETSAAPTTIAELAARDAVIVDAIQRVDAVATRAMKVRLEHALVDDSSIGAPTRNVFASTILRYAGQVSVLAQRVHDVAVRGGSRAPAELADRVVTIAAGVLAMHAAIRDGILGLASELARGSIAIADGRARDRKADERERKRWSAARRDLEAVAADPTTLLTGAMTERMARLSEQLDEPEPEPEPTIADLIELD